jgi:DNA-binding protein YbaB
MFNPLKQGRDLLKLRSQAKKMQQELEKITHSEEDGDMLVKVDATQRVVYLQIDGEERKDVVDLINKSMKEVQKEAAKKMMEMGGGLSGLLGGMGQ